MAANLEWIADEARKGSKVVIWAHNGHVQKREGGMGGWLAKHYGRDLVVFGFAANEGAYTAVSQSNILSSENRLEPSSPGTIKAAAAASGLPQSA